MTEKAVNLLESINQKLHDIHAVVVLHSSIDQHRHYTRQEAAQLLGRSTRTVDRLIKSGALESIKEGHTARITGRSLHQIRTHRSACHGARILSI